MSNSKSVTSYIELLESLTSTKSVIIDKIISGDAVEVDDFGFCRHYVVEDENLSEVIETLNSIVAYGSGTMDDGEYPTVSDLMATSFLEISFIDDEYKKYEYFFSLGDIVNHAKLDKDQNIIFTYNEMQENDESEMKLSITGAELEIKLSFYKLNKI